MYIIRKIVILICTMLVVSAFCILCSATVRSIEKGYSASADKSNTEVNSDTEASSDAESGNSGAESGAVSEPGLDSSDTSRDSGKNPSQDDSDVVLVCKGNLDGVSRELLIKLKDIVKSHPNSVSFYYENLDTGIAIAATPDKAYFCASVVKAPYIAAVLKKGVDTSEVVAIKEDVCNIPAGAELTVDQLIYYSLVHSDNNSYIELIRKYGRAVFNSYSEELGVSSRITSGHFCSMTAYEAAVYFKDIYSFALESADGKYLAEYMKKPIYNCTSPVKTDNSKKEPPMVE
ncbi:MAG TPA: serine hydrolase, partial [Bacillota bacterium]|nr:serine hydrolase [Bacillota bacterium]HOK68951.1 serine hydrolase [Bacillota bacterium]HPP85263.1 serine hydrolase [Bacillota bacterium]